MPDRLRIVQPQWPKRPTVILDIASTSIQPVRDSFKVAPGKKQKRSVPQPTREGGSRVVGERLENATISVTLAILGASADNALALASSLLAALDQVVPGQFVEWRPDGASRSTYFEMRGTAEWDNQYRWVEFSGAKLLTVAVSFEVAPRGVGDLKDVLDDWTTDSLAAADWTVDAGGGTLSVSARQLVPSDTTTKRLRHTATGYTDTDVQATLQIVAGSSVAALDDTVMVCADTSAADTHLGARLAGSGVGTSPNTLAVVKRVAGTLTVLASTAFTPAASTSYWLRVRREGYVVTAEVFTQTTEPTPLGTPTASISYTLTVSEDAAFRSGHHGLRLTPGHASERYGAYRAEPYTYRSLTCPDQVQLRGAIPGDAPARADLHITTSGAGSGSGAGTGAGGQQYPVWAGVGWTPRPALHNEVANGDFEDDADNWFATAVTGVIGAATSVTRDTTAARVKAGAAALRIQCPATTDTGGWTLVPIRAKKGRRYIGLFWASSAAGVTQTRAKLGVNGDLATGSAVALTTTPTLRWVAWTPTADRDGVFLAAGINAATLTDWSIDCAGVYEALTTDLAAAIASTSATTLQVTSNPDNLPASFWLLVDDELMLVAAGGVNGTTWTIARGVEGTTAATHAQNAAVYVLTASRSHLEGKGAPPPFAVVEAEANDRGAAGSLTLVADTNYRSGNGLRNTAAGAGSGVAEILVDPSLLVADDFSQQEVDVQVWGRFELAATLVTPVFVGSFRPAGTSTGITERYAAEPWGKTGKTLAKPSSGTAFRFHFLGTFSLPVNQAEPLRWLFRAYLSWQAGSTGSVGADYLVFLPRLANMRGVERQPLDSTYPSLVSSTAETRRVLLADGRALIASPPLPAAPYHGLGGKQLRLDPGHNDLVVKLSSMVPDDQSGSLTDSEFQAHAATVHVAVQPTYLLARAS